jgi:hypothetical protein
MRCGVETARKGGVAVCLVPNAVKLPELLRHLQDGRPTAGAQLSV